MKLKTVSSTPDNPVMPAQLLIAGVRRTRLSNGLTILTLEDHTVPVVTSMIWYRVGSRYERPGQTGLSHLLEHMMFKGSLRFPKGEVDAITARYGGTNNAFTSHDYTAYYFSFASDRWWPALEIEADRMRNALLDPREFELERQVVLEELKTELDDPWSALRMAVEQHAFRRHPYRFPVLGRRRDLERLSLNQLRGHYRRYYCPSNATLVVTGDFETARVLDRVESLFGAIPAGTAQDSTAAPETPVRGLQLKIDRPSPLSRLLLAFPAPPVSSADQLTLNVIDKILSEGRLSRLYRSLVEDGAAAAAVGGDFTDTRDPYLYVIAAELLPGARPETVLEMVFEELERLAATPPSAQEMRRAVNQCMFAFVSSFETTLDQAVQLGLMETLQRYEYWLEYPERMGEVSPSQVVRYAKRFLGRRRAVVGVMGP